MRRFCWHDWSSWKTYVWTGIQLNHRTNEKMEITRTKQARVCKKCGYELHRDIPEAAGATYDRMPA